ncbi:MAG: hypothetical protein ACW981_06020 [Candidatus Hodarchaeales archaeon]|jgi:hypothetical protein
MNWEILKISKTELIFGVPRSYLASQKSKMIIGSILMTAGGLIFLSLITVTLILGAAFFIYGFFMFRSGYRRFNNSMNLLIIINRKKKEIKFSIGRSSKVKVFSNIKDIFVLEQDKRSDPRRSKASKATKTINSYLLRIKFNDGEYLTLFEALDKLEVPNLVNQSKMLKEFCRMEKGNVLDTFIKNYRPPHSVPSFRQIFNVLIRRMVEDVYNGEITKDRENYYRIKYRFNFKKVSFWAIFYVTLGITFTILALVYNPWSGVLFENLYFNLLLTVASLIIAGLCFNLVILMFTKKITAIRFDFKLKKIHYPETENKIIDVEYSQIQYGKVTNGRRNFVLELASTSFFMRKTVLDSDIGNEFQKILEKEKLLISFPDFDF